MNYTQFCLLLLSLGSLQVHGRQQDCPLWTTLKNGSCKCSSVMKHVVQCEDGRGAQAIQKCFCMTTAENDSSSPLVGYCLYTCTPYGKSFEKLTTNTSSNLNKETCGPFHRTGVLCSKCIEGYGLPVYSYNLSCVNCTNYKYNWIKYVAVAHGPLTLFYIAAVIFRISAISGTMICYVTICQISTIRGLMLWIANAKQVSYYILPVKIVITILSIWNLDFFRFLYTPFCVHPTISALHVLLLDYLVAVYPLILILITYSLVKLHDRYTLVVWFCKPLYICFHKFRKEWDIKTSLVASFATFYLLSYVKIINVTADILTPTYYYNIQGDKSELYFYYNASMKYFGEEHLPYAVFAVIFSFLFNVCPLLLLCLYPCTCFHKCLNKTGCRCHTLHVFMDALLGSFSHKPRERRHFGALYLILRIIHAAAHLEYTGFSYIAITCYAVLILIAMIAGFQPHMKPLHNKIDIILLSSLANTYLATVLYIGTIGAYHSAQKHKIIACLYLVSTAIPLYGLAILIYKMLPKSYARQVTDWLCRKIRFNVHRRENEEEELPHRLENSERDALLH